MERTVRNLLIIAIAEIGYHEKNSDANLDDKTAPNDGNGNHTKFARDLYAAGYYNGNKCGYAWCDVFVDWCFYKLCGNDPIKAQKMIFQTGPYGAGCKYSAQYYKTAGRFYTTNPMAGDQIFFNSLNHTGLVEYVTKTTINTIEGNYNDKVVRRTYKIGDKSIDGYGRPSYDIEIIKPEDDEPIDEPIDNSDIKQYDVYTVRRGDSWWSIAKTHLGNGNKMHELAAFNYMTIETTLHPGDKINIPASNFIVYKVQKGDSWWGIAKTHLGNGNKMHELAAFNGMTINDMLHPGDVLKIPENVTGVAYKLYTVKSGDSWWSIAKTHLGNGNKMHELAVYNNKTINDAIHPGDLIKIPV